VTPAAQAVYVLLPLEPDPPLLLEPEELLGVDAGLLADDDPLSLDLLAPADSPEEPGFPSELPEDEPSDAPLREAAVEPAFP
jgi:hypothetical protein